MNVGQNPTWVKKCLKIRLLNKNGFLPKFDGCFVAWFTCNRLPKKIGPKKEEERRWLHKTSIANRHKKADPREEKTDRERSASLKAS